MRVKEIQNIDGFFKALEKCKGRVELITDEKDVLNLASRLTMKAFAGSLKNSKDESQRTLGAKYDHSFDLSDVKFIEPIVAYLQSANVA